MRPQCITAIEEDVLGGDLVGTVAFAAVVVHVAGRRASTASRLVATLDEKRLHLWVSRSQALGSDLVRRLGLRTDSCTKRRPSCTVTIMATMNISTLRENLPDAVELARTEAVFLERYGRPAAVLVSPEQYEKLTAALEDAEDVAAFDAAMDEEGPNIPWDQVKVDLGWT